MLRALIPAAPGGVRLSQIACMRPRAYNTVRSVARLRQRGKLLVRERIELLLDRASPFLELSPLAGYYTDYTVGGGLVTGIGAVSGVECIIAANDPTVLGGAITPVSMKKTDRALEISRLNRLPYVQFVESAGADLRRGEESVEAEMRRQLGHFAESGRFFHDITALSAAGIPTISVVFGSSTAGGAYQPGMSDYNIFIRGRSKVFLGGPPLVKMATGEDSDDEELGGAEGVGGRCPRPWPVWPTTWPKMSWMPSASRAASWLTSTGGSWAQGRRCP